MVIAGVVIFTRRRALESPVMTGGIYDANNGANNYGSKNYNERDSGGTVANPTYETTLGQRRFTFDPNPGTPLSTKTNTQGDSGC